MLKGLLLLLGFQFAGECLKAAFHLPVPGPIIGMILLFIALQIRQKPLAELDTCSHFLIKHLALLFLPAGVGIFFLGDVFSDHWQPIAYAIFVSTAIALLVTALAMKLAANNSARNTENQ